MPDHVSRSTGSEPRILVCGWAGAGNIGDEMLTDWMVDRIEHLGGRVHLVTRSRADTLARHPSVEPVGWRAPDIVRALGRVDAVCLGPGGIIQDRSSIWSLPAHLSRPLIGRLRRLPVAGVGLGAEPLGRRSSRFLLRRALAGAVGVVVRDAPSAAALRGAGVESQVAADLVFGLDPLTGPDRPPTGDHVVVALGPSVGPGRLRPVARRLDHSRSAGVIDSVGGWAERLGASVVVVPFRGRPDVEFGTSLVDGLGSRARLVAADHRAIRREVSGAIAVLTARYHAAVISLVEGTPAIVRSDETKLRSLTDAIHDESRIRMVPTLADLPMIEPGGRFDRGVEPGSVEPNQKVLERLVAAAVARPG